MDNLLFVLLILIPGATIKGTINKMIPGSRRKSSQIEEIVVYFGYGIIVAALTIVSMFLFGVHLSKLSDFMLRLNDMRFIWKYIGLTTVLTWCVGFILSAQWMIDVRMGIINYALRKAKRCEEKEFSTVWDEIFHNNKTPIKLGTVVQIIKGNVVLSQGEIGGYPGPYSGTSEIKLVNTSTIKEYFEYDEKCDDPEEKFFQRVIYEYYDLDKDVMLRFYDGAKYKSYVDSFISSAEAAD